MQPHDFSDVDLAFPAHALKHMPKMEDLPEQQDPRLNRIFYKLFAVGFEGKPSFHPAPEIDAEKAYRHLRVILGSFAPKHEHKERAVIYLLSQWFVKIEDDSGVLWER